jgi:hypothetical protein
MQVFIGVIPEALDGFSDEARISSRRGSARCIGSGFTIINIEAGNHGDALFHAASSMAAIVEIAFPSSLLFTKTNVLRFGPAAFPSSINALPAARASGIAISLGRRRSLKPQAEQPGAQFQRQRPP